MDILSVSSKGQIVIPERIRKRMQLKKGSKLVLFETSQGLLLTDEKKIEDSVLETLHYKAVTEKGLRDVWDNDTDDKTWNEYL